MFAFIATSIGVYKVSEWVGKIPPPPNPVEYIKETIHDRQEKNKTAIYNEKHAEIVTRRNDIREKYHDMHDHK
jgi:hypothetical protein